MGENDKNLDIVTLVSNNPLNNLSGDYNSKIIDKIKEKFNNDEQKLFIANFYCYNKYNIDTDYIIKLDDIWKWLGYKRIEECKRCLIKNFKENKHYIAKKFAPPTCGAKINEENRGGHNKENIYMTISCFKKLCIKAGTDKADEIHDYYIKMEEVINEIVYEQSEQLRNQLQLKEKEIKNTLLEVYNKKPVVYLAKVEENIIKYGSSDNIKERHYTHKREIIDNFEFVFILETEYNKELENMIRTEMKKFIISKVYKEKNQTELIQLTETYTLQRLINQLKGFEKILSDKSYIVRLVKENAYLKERLSKYEKVEEIEESEENNKKHEEILNNCTDCNIKIRDKSTRCQLCSNKCRAKKIKTDEDDEPEHTCLDCKTKIWKTSTRCNSCSSKISENTKEKIKNIPCPQQLLAEVSETSYVDVGKKYEVSDSCVRKWVKKYEKNIINNEPIQIQTRVRKVKNRPPLEQLLKEVKETSYLTVGKKYNVSDNSIRKWIKSYDNTIETNRPLVAQLNPEGKCLDCKKQVRKESLRCKECIKLYRRKAMPSQEQLLKEIESSSISEVANEHNVTPKTIRKWVKLSLPTGIEPVAS
jgi:transposase-like protein